MRVDYRAGLYAAIGYVILSIVFTYPLILHMGSHVSGVNDVWLSMWNIWWTKKAVFELHVNPYHTDYFYHPTGTSLAFHPLMLVNTIQAIFLMEFFNLSIVQAYNLLVFLSFVLASYGTFLLAEYVTGKKSGAFIAGVVYSFCIPHYLAVNVGHFNLLTVQWIPFYALYLLKAWKTRSRRDFFLVAAFFFLTAGSSIQYAGFLVMYTVIYALYSVLSQTSNRVDSVKTFVIVLSLCFIASLPFTHPIIKDMQYAIDLKNNLGTQTIFSTDFIGFLTPSILHPLYGGIVKEAFVNQDNPFDSLLLSSFGITSLLLVIWYLAGDAKFDGRQVIIPVAAFIALIPFGKFLFKESFIPVTGSILFLLIAHGIYKLVLGGVGGFWLACFSAFTLLSLGPFLHFNGIPTIPLPHIILSYIPGISIFRAPYRFLVPAYLAFSILVAFGLKRLEDSGRKNLSRIVFAFIVFEYLAAPMLMSEVLAPSFASQIALDGGDFTVLPVPVPPRKLSYENMRVESELPLFLLYQTVHGKKMIGGSIAHPDAEATEFIEKNTVIRCLNEPELIARNECDFHSDIVSQTFGRLGVKYVIVSKYYLKNRFLYNESSSDLLVSWLESSLPSSSVVYEDEEVKILMY